VTTTPSSHPPITVIGYGSLMSGLGLTRFGTLPVSSVGRVRLHDCTRGFGKFSMYGDRFAMILEAAAATTPIRAETIAAGDDDHTGVEALALTVALPEFVAIAAREGYTADASWALARQAEGAGRDLAHHLWALLEQAGFDQVAYRRTLFETVGYTSPHYIPHPVATDGAPAIIFLAPGTEGSGADHVVPIRVQSTVTRVLTLPEVWRIKPNADQLDYIAMCLLGEIHGISVADVHGALADNLPLLNRVRERVVEGAPTEPERFREMLQLTEEDYAAQLPPRTPRSLVLS